MGLFPTVLVTGLFPAVLVSNIAGAFTSYQSFLENGPTAFFLAPFLPPFRRHLFLPSVVVMLREPERPDSHSLVR